MGLNKVIFQGNLTADPEARVTTSGVSVTTFTIAVGRRFAKPEDEVKADFFTIVAWRGLADFVVKNFHKGKSIIVVGNLQNRSYTNQEGQKRYVTEVVAEECYFAGNKEQNTSTNAIPSEFAEIGDDDDLPFN
jgi:single-strand DNA-binding protein